MNDTQLLAAVAVATVLTNLIIVGILIKVAQINSLRKHLDMHFDEIDQWTDESRGLSRL
ncbi:MAG TPA: hypothetical protein VEV17_04435 [Bryobacteraceae bacterium]|nr:hypothetical protein [Bryobacteraceae bacterium]